MILELLNTHTTEVVKRPSQFCKTPYVADVRYGEEGETTLAHSPSLGCCGLADKGSKIIVTKVDSSKSKCSHRIDLAVLEERGYTFVIGINPKLAETLIHNTLKENKLSFLGHCQNFCREKKILNSRFDFYGTDESGQTFYMEVKNVPLADYVDVPKKERKKYLHLNETMDVHEKIAYFPDGYRKSGQDIVSPRALKHIEELQEIKTTTDHRTILCFVVQRMDVKHFQPSHIDPTYRKAVIEAAKKGVEIRAIQFEWTLDGKCKFIRDDLPVVLEE